MTTKRTYMLNMKGGGRQKVTVPANWRLTFGPLVPGSKSHEHNGSQACVLRFYEGNKDNQRAVFTGVESFRDTKDLSVEVERIETKQQTVQAETPEGNKSFVVEAILKDWVSPDQPRKPGTEYTALPRQVQEVE